MATTRYIVNNVSGQTINGQSVTPSYKVYTALLTQSGGDNPLLIGSGEITIGVTYVINKGKVDTGDFTNVGAPNNNDGTYFVATGTTPNEWGGTELGYNEGAPVVTVLENTIGNIWFIYNSTGKYRAISDALFSLNKTTIEFGSTFQTGNNLGIMVNTDSPTVDDFNIYSISSVDQDYYNDLLFNTKIEIRVYN